MDDQSPMHAVKDVNHQSWLSWGTKFYLFRKTVAQATSIAIGLAALAISLATLFVVEWQAQIYEKQREVMSQQMDITKKAERAYVGVASLDADLKNGKVIVLLQNVGHIPATGIRVKLLGSRRNADDSSHGAIEPLSFQGQQLFGTLKMRLSLSLDLQQGEADDIMAKKETLYINVTIQYNDGFDTAEKTESLFRFDGAASDNWTLVPTPVSTK